MTPSETSNLIASEAGWVPFPSRWPAQGARLLVLHKGLSQELRGRDSSMLPKPESACFVIADISGYTGFLAGVELEHAQDIIADVMDTMVRRLRPPFRLAKFEGDAAFFYAVADKVDGSVLQDAVEAAYFAFRKRLRNISQATSCTCNACSRMQDLDLKFVCHHGEFIKQKMSGRDELAGRDVILVHRLLKNGVNERLGGHAYALYSDPCIRAMGIDPAAQGLVEHRESIDIIGEVTCWVRDLETAWQQEKDQRMNPGDPRGRGSRDRVRHRRPASGGVGAFHPARAAAEMAGGRRGARDFAERPARGRDRQSLHARSPRHH